MYEPSSGGTSSVSLQYGNEQKAVEQTVWVAINFLGQEQDLRISCGKADGKNGQEFCEG